MDALLNTTEQLLKEYNELEIEQSQDWEKYNHYSIVHHSTSIEGATLTMEETQTLLDDGITAKGKPVEHHLMQQDHYEALKFTLESAVKELPVTINFLQELSSKILKRTGGIVYTALGNVDASKGELRLFSVTAGETRFVDYKKVPDLLYTYCSELQALFNNIKNNKEALLAAFDAHFNLVSIHPFSDGNGRLSRLMMNYVQHRFKLPLSNVFKEDKAEYYKALVDTRKNADMSIFRKFMLEQYNKMLSSEIDKTKEASKTHIHKPQKGGFGMSLMF